MSSPKMQCSLANGGSTGPSDTKGTNPFLPKNSKKLTIPLKMAPLADKDPNALINGVNAANSAGSTVPNNATGQNADGSISADGNGGDIKMAEPGPEIASPASEASSCNDSAFNPQKPEMSQQVKIQTTASQKVPKSKEMCLRKFVIYRNWAMKTLSDHGVLGLLLDHKLEREFMDSNTYVARTIQGDFKGQSTVGHMMDAVIVPLPKDSSNYIPTVSSPLALYVESVTDGIDAAEVNAGARTPVIDFSRAEDTPSPLSL